MEKEIEKIYEKFKKAKNELELKDRECDVLDKLIGEQVEEINILIISENVMMENKINVQNKMIKVLNDKMKDQSELINQEEELIKLVDEIRYLKDVNEEKEIELENISKQNE